MRRHLTIMILAALVLITAIAYAQESRVITYQGYMTDAVGNPIEGGPHEIVVSFFPLQSGGDPFMVESFFDVYFTMGRFSLALDPGLENIGWPLWVEFAVDGETLAPRQQITQAAFSAVTQRVNGDILTAPGVLEVSPDPCIPPDPCLPGVAISADSITSSIKINWPDPPEMTSSAIELASVGNDGSKIWMYHPLADPPGPMIELNADPVGGSSIVIHSAEPLLGGSGIFRGTSTTGSILSLNHNPRPHEQVSVIELSSAPEDFGHIKMFNGRIEPPPVYLEMNTAYSGDQTGSNFIMYNSDPANYGLPVVELSTNSVGDQSGASLVMFNPQPEPPGNEPFLEIQATENGGSMNLYEGANKYMGVGPSPFRSGGAMKFYDSSGGSTVEINTDGDVIAKRGKFGQNNMDGGVATFMAGANNSSSADYFQLFGINSAISQDSTFMVDMPHIRFGDESNGYEFPTADGYAGQALFTDGNGQLGWMDMSIVESQGNKQLLEIIDKLTAKVDQLENKIADLEKNISR